MIHFHETRKWLAANGSVKQLSRLLGFAAALHNTIDPEFLVAVRLQNLPSA